MADNSVQDMLAKLAGKRAEAKTAWHPPMLPPSKSKVVGKVVPKASQVDVKKLYPSTMNRSQAESAYSKLIGQKKTLSTKDFESRYDRLMYLIDTAEN